MLINTPLPNKRLFQKETPKPYSKKKDCKSAKMETSQGTCE